MPDTKRFTKTDLVVLIVFDCIGIPLCIAGAESAVHFDWLPTFVGFGIGIPLSAFGTAFPFIGVGPMKTAIRDWCRKYAGIALPAAALLAFGFVAVPNIYNRLLLSPAPRTEKITWNMEQAARGQSYFLNMYKAPNQEVRILGFQAHGKNNSNDPVSQFSGYMRSDLTNATLPIYILAQDTDDTKVPICIPRVPTLPQETLVGLPVHQCPRAWGRTRT